MKVAIPIFQTKVSPRFDSSKGFVLFDVEYNSIVDREKLITIGWSDSAKIKHLIDLGIDTLICGGIDRVSMQQLSANDIRVFAWVTGEIEDAIWCYLGNRLESGVILGERGRLKERWRFKSGRPHWERG